MKNINLPKLILICIAALSLTILIGSLPAQLDADNDQHAEHEGCDGCNEHADQDKHGEHGDEAGHDDHEECDEHPDHDKHEEHSDEAGHKGCDEHADNDKHDEHGEEAEHDDHEGHDDHDDHNENIEDSHAGHDHDASAQLTPKQLKKSGVSIAVAAAGKLLINRILPGEVKLNADKVAHITPATAGIVRAVNKNIGDKVRKGEIFAWLESSELGKAKVEYLSILAEINCCAIDYNRNLQIHDNTNKLLEILKKSPNLEELSKLDDIPMGNNRSLLISAYAEYQLARESYRREKELFEKNISSKQDFLNAQNQYQKTEALYLATADTVGFNIQQNLLESRQTRQTSQIELINARRNLYILGQTEHDIEELNILYQNTPVTASLTDDISKTAHVCNDPNCKTCPSENEGASTAHPVEYESSNAEEKLAWYPLRAPFDSIVIEKHITLGEKLSDESNAFTIADLQTVWVDVNISQNDLAVMKPSSPVIIYAGDKLQTKATGKIKYISPVISPVTRTAIARVELKNPNRRWSPGLFVTVDIAVDSININVLVPKSAVQTVEGKKCVFIQDQDDYKPQPVILGRANRQFVEITSGLTAGAKYVADGGFELKAARISQTLDNHAGHGH